MPSATEQPPSPLPIVIAGGGCVGLFLALLLANSTIPNKIIVLEPSDPDPTSTRAMAHQPPTFPLLSRVPGLLDELIAAGSLSSGLCFRTSMATGNRMIAAKTFDNSGSPKGRGQLLLPQGKFQAVLLARLHALGREKVEIRSAQLAGFSETNTSSVNVTIEAQDDSTPQHLEAAYLVGADGAHSTVRKLLKLDLAGETLDAFLVATDIRFPFPAHGFSDANFVIDPRHYGLIGRINDSGLWRVSYGVPVETSEEEIHATVGEKLRDMLPNGGRDAEGKDAFEVVRVAPYRAQQRCVEEFWREGGRVGVLGDAAHLTNPYAGLGLASGIADASSLAEVLTRILTPSHQSATDPAKLLSSWSTARRAKFFAVVDKPSRAAYARVKSNVATDQDVQDLLARDPLVGALKKGMPVAPPSLETKGEELEGW